MKYAVAVFFAAVSAGCVSDKVEAPTVRPWEGRYSSKADAVKAVSGMELEKGESVWMLSNSTLKRLLKTTTK